ncbi:MAG: SHOCT-like domain-containing protein [Myxococcales bacterium]
MNEERRRILDLLAAGKVTAAEADQLLAALETKEPPAAAQAAARDQGPASPKYLRVLVEGYLDDQHPGGKVNVRVPMNLLRAGVKLAALLPAGVSDQINAALHKQGIDVDVSKIKPDNLEAIVDQLRDLTVDVDGPQGERVRVFCE